MTQRIEFKGFVTVDQEAPLDVGDARRQVIKALYLGDRFADGYTTTLDEVTFFSTVGDDE
ncbi:hypothetical protein CP967_31350 [Streptomyces nitrosporeus]|uniref:Uncharacterized protein n=1 Tax=Streptomyces nitrosporeus TaxID=28894 RepID=A0A5J6FIQ5_9ACTN|nr:hypothetical protein [Streptomyces nitrosporeus]QEU75866.1 hypothetical protein CP967_31350 [Streptomyces nitrosporeus]GGY88931.1 hypothetical protein GCM10010327_19600 [Streptomyces nitrosporeus]